MPNCRRELTVALKDVMKDEKTPMAKRMTHTAKNLRSFMEMVPMGDAQEKHGNG